MPTIRPEAGIGSGEDVMRASKVGDVYLQTQGSRVTTIFQEEIEIPEKRERAPNKEAIRDLKVSLASDGLLHPIGVRVTKEDLPKRYELIYGANRLLAWRELRAEADMNLRTAGDAIEPAEKKRLEQEIARWDRIPTVVYPKGMSKALCRRYELVENLRRADLSRDERKRFEAEYLKMLINERKEEGGGKSTTSRGGGKSTTSSQGARKLSEGGELFVKWYKEAGKDKSAASKEWNAFKAASGIAASSDKCSVEELAQFQSWYTKKGDEQAKAAADAKSKSESEAAEKAKRKRHEAAVAALRAVLEQDGEPAVKAVIADVMVQERSSSNPVNGSASPEADTKALAEAITASPIARDDLIEAARGKIAKGHTVTASNMDAILAGRVVSYHIRDALWSAMGGKPEATT